MHNRVRMIAASLPRQGPAHRLAARGRAGSCATWSTATWPRTTTAGSGPPGTGTDAAPYFRVFNPTAQGHAVRSRRRLHPPLGARAAQHRGPGGARALEARQRPVRGAAAGLPGPDRRPRGRARGGARAATVAIGSLVRRRGGNLPGGLALGSIECQTQPSEVRMLDERKASILRAVVEEYIETAQPVGSGHVAAAPGVQVSSATVRNEMAVLEQEGYLAQPHTVAGRIPTEKGYRYFVDHLAAARRSTAAAAQQVRAFFDQAHGELEQMLPTPPACCPASPTTPPSSSGPPHEAATVRSVQLVGLAPRRRCWSSPCSPTASVEKRTIELAEPTSTRRALGRPPPTSPRHLVGSPLAGARRGRRRAATPRVDAVLVRGPRRGRWCGAADEADHVFVGGASRMAGVVRRGRDRPRGAHHPRAAARRGHPAARRARPGPQRGHRQPRPACSRWPSARSSSRPYKVDGEPVGTIGVLGPTRMNYPQALAAVAVVSKRLGAPAERGLTVATDYYELLGRRARRQRRRDQAGLPAAGPRAPPRRQPRRRRRPRPGSRRSPAPTRC